MKKALPKAVAVKSFASVIADATERAKQEQARINALSPAERKKWEKEETARSKELEEILKELRGPGFLELNINL